MSKFDLLSRITIKACGDGHSGLFTTSDLALIMKSQYDDAFRSFLGKACKNKVIKRVSKGIYINPLTPPNPRTAIYQIISLLRFNHCNYISLESQLSHLGIISQIMMGHVTVMTNGRSGTFTTDYGVIEFTHTMRSSKELGDALYYDRDVGMFRAKQKKAIADLKRVGRNINMLEESLNAK
jgi:hypothetical protein